LPAKPKKAEDENEETPSKAPKRRKALIISSDEEEVAASPPDTKKRKASKAASSEDDVVSATPEPEAKKARNGQKPTLSKLKRHVDPSELFGGETKRVVVPKPKTKAVLEFENEDIDRSLMEVDLEESVKEEKVSSPRRRSPSPKRAKKSSPEPVKAKPTKSKAVTPRAKKEKPPADLESSILNDEERHERKRMTATQC